MSGNNKESHTRSLLKGITWRILATADTVFIVLAITCWQGHCSAENALKIGGAEFLLKLLVYYLHERIWQHVLKADEVTKMKSLHKTISWRVVATSMTFVISGTVLNAFDGIALGIAITELFTKFALYYLHERLWQKVPLGRVRSFWKNKQP